MKNKILFSLLFCIALLTACNEFKPENYTPITSYDMGIVAEKMLKEKLPLSTTEKGMSWAECTWGSNGPSLSYNLVGKNIFCIIVPKPGVVIQIDTAGRIIRAWGYSDNSMTINDYYSEVYESSTKTPQEAKDFYVGYARAVVNWVKNYDEDNPNH